MWPRPTTALVVLVVLLAGCTTSIGPGNDTSTPSGPGATDADLTATPAPAAEPIDCAPIRRAPPATDWAEKDAFGYRVDALRGLGNASATIDRYRSGERGTVGTRLAGTFDNVSGADAIDGESVFEVDLEVVDAVGTANESVGGNLARADARLASAAIADARRAALALVNRSVRFDRATVCDRLDTARAAAAAGDRLRSDGDYAGAIDQYRRSWRASNDALDVLDEAMAPDIGFPHRADPARPVPPEFLLVGTVYDVRIRDLSNVTVVANGERTTVRPRVIPGEDRASFATRVTIDDEVADIRVSVTDRGDGAVGEARIQLDGDGLPGRYERNATTTDPLDPDSDATATAATEGGDGVPDAEEDLDGDRFTNQEEMERGTDPLAADTDEDDLDDFIEVLLTDTDPLDPDSDGDGTPDGAEDPDGDGATSAEEVRRGSDPTHADGDRDGLSDERERELGTDPSHPDTDEDGVTDARELELGTDPLDPDTDGDGVPDGDERTTARIDRPDLDVSVAVTGPGDPARAIQVEREFEPILDNSGTRAASVSPMIRITERRPFTRAAITFEYDPSKVGDPRNVAIYRFDWDVQTFVLLESRVDPNDHTVTATTTTDGTYVAFNATTWRSLFAEPLPEPGRSIEISEENVTCEGSGECRVENGTIILGDPPEDWEPPTPEPTPTTRDPTYTGSKIVTDEPPTATELPTPESDVGDDGGSLVEWITGVGEWLSGLVG